MRGCVYIICTLLVASCGLTEQACHKDQSEQKSEDCNEQEVCSLLSTQILIEQKSFKAADADSEELLEAPAASPSWTFYHYSLFPLLVLTAATSWFTRPQLSSEDEMTPAFRLHRYRFLSVWAIAVSADWLQGPYVYALYDSFGYDKPTIDRLFVAGFASSMVFGTFAGSLSDAWGRKRTVLLYCILYVVSCLTKHCDVYSVLMFGRVTGGMATSLLFSAFECWMVSESNEHYQFSPALLRYMFSLMYFVSYLAAIVSGLVAQVFVDAVPMRRIEGFDSLHYGGNICAFDLAIVMLCIAFPMIYFSWTENYGCSGSLSGQQEQPRVVDSFVAAFRAITSSYNICVIGIVVSCFEGSMYAFVINWTPTLSVSGAPQPPHGLIFSTMMMSCMIGSSIFSFFNPRINPAIVLVFACFSAALAFAFVSLETDKIAFVSTMYMCFLCFEVCVGLYFPAVGALKSEWVPEVARAGIYSWYRVPLNMVVCSVILTDMKLRLAYAVCASLMLLGAAAIAPVALMPSKLVYGS